MEEHGLALLSSAVMVEETGVAEMEAVEAVGVNEV